VNCQGGSISRIAPDRTVTTFAESDLLACPNGITFDDQGDLYVVNFNNTKVVRVTPEGVVSDFADIPGAGGNGHIDFARGTFFVTKFRGHRVYRLRRDGSFEVLAGTGAPGEADAVAREATFTRPNGIAVGAGGRDLWVNDLTEGQGLGVGPSLVTMRRIHVVALSDVLETVDGEADAEALREVYREYHEARPGGGHERLRPSASLPSEIPSTPPWPGPGGSATSSSTFRKNRP